MTHPTPDAMALATDIYLAEESVGLKNHEAVARLIDLHLAALRDERDVLLKENQEFARIVGQLQVSQCHWEGRAAAAEAERDKLMDGITSVNNESVAIRRRLETKLDSLADENGRITVDVEKYKQRANAAEAVVAKMAMALKAISEGEYDDLDPDDGLAERSARRVARVALAAEGQGGGK